MVMTSQVFHQKLKIKTTKVSKEDFLLVDMAKAPTLTKNNHAILQLIFENKLACVNCRVFIHR